MATADKDLKTAIKDGLGEKLNVENVQEDEKYIEMDVAVMDVSFFLNFSFFCRIGDDKLKFVSYNTVDVTLSGLLFKKRNDLFIMVPSKLIYNV